MPLTTSVYAELTDVSADLEELVQEYINITEVSAAEVFANAFSGGTAYSDDTPLYFTSSSSVRHIEDTDPTLLELASKYQDDLNL